MEIVEIAAHKKQFLSLLLLADEQESMIDRYLERGTLYALHDPEVRAVCVVTDEGGGIFEIKNLAVAPEHQRKGYGRTMIALITKRYAGKACILQVGTGDSPLTVPFYEACGFRRTHAVKNFFVDYYDHPIFECGHQLVDMIYLQKQLCP